MSARVSVSSGAPPPEPTFSTGERSSSIALVTPALPTARCNPSNPAGPSTSVRPDAAALYIRPVSSASI
jgi:hypothetical protein